MKLEMGESLCYSWLRHVQGCQIVQLNWKPAKKPEDIDSPEKKEKLKDLIKIINNDNLFKELNIFKKKAEKTDEDFEDDESKKKFNTTEDSALAQLLKQTECDLVGVKVDGNKDTQFFTVDVAFHIGGLNYNNGKGKSKLEGNMQKLASKMVRTAFCLYLFMNTTKAKIYFATPLITGDSNKEYDKINEMFDKLNDIFKDFSDEKFEYEFKLIANENFKSLVEDVMKEVKDYTDTSELFVRAMQLNNVLNKEQKIGKRDKVVELIESYKTNGELADDVLDALLGKDKQTSKLLIAENGKIPTGYYTDAIKINNKNYYISNNKVEEKIEKLKKHLEAQNK